MTGRSLFRVLRWGALAAVAPVLWACNARSLEAPVLTPDQTFVKPFAQSINRNIDLLFLVDDSTSMRPAQQNLNRNFPTFMSELRMIPGGLPNVHIAVISSDMGASDGVQQCNSAGGKQGIFQNTQRDATACGMGSLNGTDRFISDVGGVRNYTGTLEGAFTCIAALGDVGCGFEQQFAAITRALGVDGQGGPPGENAGFLRPEAYLGIILITNEDDCSTGVGPNFYDTTANVSLGSQLGPVQSYRCNEFGHLCNGAPPPRLAPNGMVTDTVGPLMNCVSAEGSGYLKTVAETIAQVKSAKPDPSQIIVASIQGAPEPYGVHWIPALTTDSGPWPEVTHSCMSSDGSFADPGIRTKAFVDSFGGNGLTMSICETSFAPALTRIAQLIGQALTPPCITQTVARKPGTSDYDCTVVSHTSNGSGGFVDSTVPACTANGNTAPCWQLVNGANCGGLAIDPMMLQDPNATSAAAQNATVSCSLCIQGRPDPDRMCP